MKYLVVPLALVILMFLLSVKGRIGHKDLKQLKKWYYAHRGLHEFNVPENSMIAFRNAMEAGYGMELDIHLLKDGNLAVIHDASLERTVGAKVFVEDLTRQELLEYSLQGTNEKIPLLSQVLDLVQGKVPLIIELKPVGNNFSQLCRAACGLLENYEGLYCIESFDPRCVRWLKKHKPHIVRGQLTMDFFRSNSKLPWMAKFMMRHQIYNFLCKPDFIAYRYSDRRTLSNYICRKIWRMQGVSWTIKNRDDFNKAVSEGWIPIFESFKP